MAIDIKVPTFPESVADGTLIEWHKQQGDPVARDELIAEIETDKVVFEVRAPENGVIDAVKVEQGTTVESEQVLATMTAGAVSNEGAAAATDATASAAQSESSAVKASPSQDSEPTATPSAKKMIAEHGLDSAAISGSGRHGQ